MTMSMTTEAAAPSPNELASTYIRQYLGGGGGDDLIDSLSLSSLTAKLNTLQTIQYSLSNCFHDSTANEEVIQAALVPTNQWRNFLVRRGGCGDSSSNERRLNTVAEKEEEDEVFALRDGLVACLIEGCHYSSDHHNDKNPTYVDNNFATSSMEANDDDEDIPAIVAAKIIESSLICLTYLISLRSASDTTTESLSVSPSCPNLHSKRTRNKTKKVEENVIDPIFGHDFVMKIAPDIVMALQLPSSSSSSGDNKNGDNDDDNGVPQAACELLIALLNPNRPRNEVCLEEVRELILLPACRSGTSTTPFSSFQAGGGGSGSGSAMEEGNVPTTTTTNIMSVARIAQVLSSSIIAGVEYTVPVADYPDIEELSMRRETATLNWLQNMRDVMFVIGSVCSTSFLTLSLESNDKMMYGQMILDAIREIHFIAAFAVESQLETLLDDKSAVIISRLTTSEEGGDDKKCNMSLSMESNDSSDLNLDDMKTELGQTTSSTEVAIAPLYATIARPPIVLTTARQLDSMLLVITDKLSTSDAELWDERLDALITLECILAGGIITLSADVRYSFIERIRIMNISAQFIDLRSQITNQACRVIVAMSYEYRDYVVDDAQLNQMIQQFVETCIPSILTLCMSGTRLMATQGTSCLMCLTSACGSIGYPRIIPRLCDEVLGPKVHKNRKRGSVIALSCALRVWDPVCFLKYIDQLTKAVKEGVTNRDPTVRDEGRKLYWAMRTCCEETEFAVQNMFDSQSREMRNLMKERLYIDTDWEDGGSMSKLVQTGVLDKLSVDECGTEKMPPTRSHIPPAAASIPANSKNTKRPVSARLKAQHGTPFKAQKVSTPMKSATSACASGVLSPMKLPPTANNGTASQLLTPNVESTNATRSLSGNKSINRNQGSSSKLPPHARSSLAAPPHMSREEKENSIATLDRSVKDSEYDNYNPASPIATESSLVNLLSPLSINKPQNTFDALGDIITMFSDQYSSPHQQSLGIKTLVLLAKENPLDPSWEDKFPCLLNCLLDHIRGVPVNSVNKSGSLDFMSSPMKNLSSSHQMQYLFLQAVRSLIQYIPCHVKSDDQLKSIIHCMLESTTNDAPFEIVNTAENILGNLVTTGVVDPELCLQYLLPYTTRIDIDLNDKSSPSVLLSTLRTLRFVIDRISIATLRQVVPSLLTLFHTTLCHKSVDMRKATVFILVEIQVVLGDECQLLDKLSEYQRKLVHVYVERHPRHSIMAIN